MDGWLYVLAIVGGGLLGACTLAALSSSTVRERAALRTLTRAGVAPSDDAGPTDLLSRVEKLELAFPAYRMAMDEIAERCDDVLDTAERKRRRAAARDAREREPEPAEPAAPPTRQEQLRLVRARLEGRG